MTHQFKSSTRRSGVQLSADHLDKFWSYESGIASIDDTKLYAYLHKKGYRYFPSDSNQSYIIIVTNNKLDVLFQKVWRLSSSLVDKDFISVTKEERDSVKNALHGIRKSLKKNRLVQLTPEDLEGYENSGTIRFLLNLKNESQPGEGGKL
ncbi:MAG: hypothetical protein JXB49_14120 [Bacteroidales bacterium]|nr:hypothetical protein [Bacteroidales bacterium]